MATIITSIPEDATLKIVSEYTGNATYEALVSDASLPEVVYMTRETIESLIMDRTAEDDTYECHFEQDEFGTWVWITFEYEDGDFFSPDRVETFGLLIDGSTFYRVEGSFLVR